MHNSIGGFFELELPKGANSYHKQAREALSSGRACLLRICQQIHPLKVHVPFYICDSVLLALDTIGVSYDFYGISKNLEIVSLPILNDREYILYINYFGLKDSYICTLEKHYREKLLLDLTQAFYYEPSDTQWAFNSARKYFGVPDGAYLYGNYSTLVLPQLLKNSKISLTHLLLRELGQQKDAYEAFVAYESALDYSVTAMSSVSQSWLSWIDYDDVAKCRRRNYDLYDKMLGPINKWRMPLNTSQVPFCYPFRTSSIINRKYLFDKNIFVPSLWQDVKGRNNSELYPFEVLLTDELLPLPVDHRYSLEEIKYIAEQVIHLVEQT